MTVANKLDELAENGGLAAFAGDGKTGGVVEMAVDLFVVLVVRVLWPKDHVAQGAGEMLDVEFLVQGGDVGPAQGVAAVGADEAEAAKVVALAESILLAGLVVRVVGEELGCYIDAAVAAAEAVEVEDGPQGADELPAHALAAAGTVGNPGMTFVARLA